MATPLGHELQVRSRSGLALKSQIVVANSPGTVDSDYRGEIGVILRNNGTEDYSISHGDRIAQGVISPIQQIDKFIVVEELGSTNRGTGGYGSTGV